MDWMTGQDCTFAYGREHGYLVVTEPSGVRLARFSIAAAQQELAARFAREVAASVIVFPLGRGPGRPAGEPELGLLTQMAKAGAEQFEAGGDLVTAFGSWQHAAETVRVAPRRVFYGTPPANAAFRFPVQSAEAERAEWIAEALAGAVPGQPCFMEATEGGRVLVDRLARDGDPAGEYWRGLDGHDWHLAHTGDTGCAIRPYHAGCHYEEG